MKRVHHERDAVLYHAAFDRGTPVEFPSRDVLHCMGVVPCLTVAAAAVRVSKVYQRRKFLRWHWRARGKGSDSSPSVVRMNCFDIDTCPERPEPTKSPACKPQHHRPQRIMSLGRCHVVRIKSNQQRHVVGREPISRRRRFRRERCQQTTSMASNSDKHRAPARVARSIYTTRAKLAQRGLIFHARGAKRDAQR